MAHTINYSAPVFGETIVTVNTDEITVSRTGKSARSVQVNDVRGIRFREMASPYHSHYTFEVESNSKPLKLEYRSNQKDPNAKDGFVDAIVKILESIAQQKPDMPIELGNKFGVRFALFVLYATLSVLSLGFALLMLGEPDAWSFALGAFVIGAVNTMYAYLCFPWRPRKFKSIQTLQRDLEKESGLKNLV